MIKLGDKVKDKVTGFSGVVIGITEWLYGCRRMIVQPPVKKNGEYAENNTFDEPQLTKVGKVNGLPEKTTTGGFDIKVMQKELRGR